MSATEGFSILFNFNELKMKLPHGMAQVYVLIRRESIFSEALTTRMFIRTLFL